jgi:hypothetical protein
MSYSPKRIGKPEGFPWSPLDGRQPYDRRIALSAIDGTVTAQTVSKTTGHTVSQTLWSLRQLAVRDQVEHSTDEAGVMRWIRKPENGWEEGVPF